jgi:hypothetical protein
MSSMSQPFGRGGQWQEILALRNPKQPQDIEMVFFLEELFQTSS